VQVSVRFFTVLREITGEKEETLQLPEDEKITLNIVLKKLSQKYGKAFAEYVYDSETGEVKGFLQFFINGKSASTLKGVQTELRAGDTIAIVPPVGGG